MVRKYAYFREECRSGFTLIEVLIVVVLMAIAAAVVIPQVSSTAGVQVSAGARTVMDDIQFAQNRAISTQQYTCVVFQPSKQTYSLWTFNTTTNKWTELTHPIFNDNYTMTLGGSGPNSIGGTTLTSASFGGLTGLMFDEMGAPYAKAATTSPSGAPTSGALVPSGGTVVLTSGTSTLTLTVQTNTGQIAIQ